jgi:hypothetical protein
MPPISLAQELARCRERIARAGSKGLNEQNTRATLVEPVLGALGWEVHDVTEVEREFRQKSRDKPVDYALLVMREPRLFVEAKGLGGDLNDRRWANQIMGYAAVAGVEWIVLTDGNEYRIYNSHASVPVEQKLLLSIRLADATGGAGELLGLLSKEQLQTNRLGLLWKAHFVDRQVKAALNRFFSRDDDMPLVNFVQRFTQDLSPEDIRGSMRRCKVALEFPLTLAGVAEATRTAGAARNTRTTRQASAARHEKRLGREITIQDLIQAGALAAPLRISCRYKDTDLEARILADGTVNWNGKQFDTLSGAGSAARASVVGLRANMKNPSTDGWRFWRFRDASGNLVAIDRLRQEYVAKQET